METQHTQTTATPFHADLGIQQLNQVIAQSVEVEKIICFGSFTQQILRKSCFGEVADVSNGTKNRYALLVVPPVSQTLATSGSLIQQQVEKAARPFAEVTVLVHNMEEINAALQNGSSFFSTICKKGALLHDRNTIPFVSPGPGEPLAQRIARREEFWNKRHDLARGFLQGAAFYQNIKLYDLAVYMLNQAMQHGYRGVLRAMVGYYARVQNLRRLFRLVEATVPHLSIPWQVAADNQLVDILFKGHGEAYYNGPFEVSEAQITVLMDHVATLLDTADTDCRLRLKQLKDGEAVS